MSRIKRREFVKGALAGAAVRTGRQPIFSVEAAAHDEMMCQMGHIAIRLKRKTALGPVAGSLRR